MKDLTIKPNTTIIEAMEVLNRTGEKVLLVVDKNNSLIGSLSDGDIRRCILSNGDLHGTIEKSFNKKPIYIYENEFSIENGKKILAKNVINLVPIIDYTGKVVDFFTWEKAFGNKRDIGLKIKKVPAVIMAGGRGARLDPFTRVLPKPLVPLDGKPMIDHIIERFRDYGVKEFYLTINYLSKIMRAYFEEKNPDYLIELAEEDEPRGTAGSIKLLKDKLNAPFFVSNCDILVDADYFDLYNFHQEHGYDITLVAATKQYELPYGICEINDSGSLECIQEKPKHSYLVNTGFYILNPDIIDMIPDNGMFHITHLMNKVSENNGTIGVYPVGEKAWIDVGEWSEYRKACKAIK